MAEQKIKGAPPLSHHPRRGISDWFDLILKDHGFLRLGWQNLHKVSTDVFRANQPAPKDVKRYAKELELKAILNLRGPRQVGTWRLEKEACDKAGITLIDVVIRSRHIPSAEDIKNFDLLFKSAPRPFLMHCKSGADRAGVMSALYLLLVENASVDEALKMLSLKYFHVKQSSTGILDAFIEAYRPAQERGLSFLEWAENEMDADAIKASFETKTWANRLIDDILRRE